MTEQFVFVHGVSTLLPDVSQLLQGGADLLPRRDAHPPQVVAADGEAGDGPPAELGQQLLLPLILQQLAQFGLRVQLPTLKNTARVSRKSPYEDTCYTINYKNKIQAIFFHRGLKDCGCTSQALQESLQNKTK